MVSDTTADRIALAKRLLAVAPSTLAIEEVAIAAGLGRELRPFPAGHTATAGARLAALSVARIAFSVGGAGIEDVLAFLEAPP